MIACSTFPGLIWRILTARFGSENGDGIVHDSTFKNDRQSNLGPPTGHNNQHASGRSRPGRELNLSGIAGCSCRKTARSSVAQLWWYKSLRDCAEIHRLTLSLATSKSSGTDLANNCEFCTTFLSAQDAPNPSCTNLLSWRTYSRLAKSPHDFILHLMSELEDQIPFQGGHRECRNCLSLLLRRQK